MSRNNKQPVINNISQLNLEIDYDKLADAIVRAQDKAKQEKESEGDQKTNFFKAILKILKGEKNKDGRFLSAPFALVISAFFRIVAMIGVMSVVLFVYVLTKTMINSVWQGLSIVVNIFIIALSVSIALAVLLYMFLFWGAANDVENEKDKNYVVSVFSGLVSVGALVAAIIALSK